MDCAPHFEKMLYDNPQLARVYLHAWQVTGNDFFRTVTEGSAHGFESKNILEFVGDMDQRPTLAEARRKPFKAREKRIHPGRDEKVLTSPLRQFFAERRLSTYPR